MHGKNIVSVPGRKINIMENHNDSSTPFSVQLCEKIQNFYLVGNIQKGSGFVQQQNIRLLCQGQCNPHPLALSA